MLPLDQPTKTSIIINPHDNTNTQVHDQVHYQTSDNSNNNNIILHKNVENDQESSLSIKNNNNINNTNSHNNLNRQNYRTEEGPRIFRGYDNNNNIIYEEKPNIYNSHHNIKISDNTEENNNNQLGQQNFHTNEVQSQPNPLYLQPTSLRREILKKQLTGDIHQISQDSGCPTIHYGSGLKIIKIFVVWLYFFLCL